MLDVAVSYNRFKFIGHEFLTWLWFMMEERRDELKLNDNYPIYLEIGNGLIVENMTNDAVEKITIKGDDAGLEEGIMALKKGAVVTEVNLICKTDDFDCQFTVKGESLAFSALKVPETVKVKKPEDLEGAALERIFFYENVSELMASLFYRFLKLRLSQTWKTKTVKEIKTWMKR